MSETSKPTCGNCPSVGFLENGSDTRPSKLAEIAVLAQLHMKQTNVKAYKKRF